MSAVGRRLLVGSLVLVASLVPQHAWSASASLGTAWGVRGVEVSLDDGRSWLAFGGGSFPILEGTRVRAAGGSALVDLADGSRVHLLAFGSVRFRGVGSGLEAALEYGRLGFRLPSSARLEIRTPSARLEPGGGDVRVGEVFASDGTTGLRMRQGRLRIAELAGARRTMLARLEPVFLPTRPSGAGPFFSMEAPPARPAGERGIFGPSGQSLGYLVADGRLVLEPGHTMGLAQPFPWGRLLAAMTRIPESHRDGATPLFDVNARFVGYMVGPTFYAQAVITPGAAGSAEVLLARPIAEVAPRGQVAMQTLARGARLSPGDRVRTGQGGAAELRMGDGSLVRLGELSDLEIEQMDVDSPRGERTSPVREARRGGPGPGPGPGRPRR